MKSKKVLFGIALLATAASACALAACADITVKPADKEYNPTLGYKLPYRETDPGVTIDGVLDDEIYKNQNRLNCKKVQGAEEAEIEMVTYFGEKGIYIGTSITENSGIYFNPVKPTTDNSCVELYLSMGGVKSIDEKRKCFEIDMCCNGTVNLKQKLINGIWTSILGTNDARITYAARTVGGEYNTPECTGYTCELFIPFEFLIDYKAMEEGETIEEIYCNPALITSYGYESGTKRNWFDVANYNISSYSWGIPSSAYVFDKDGLVSNSITIETNEGGALKETHGYDYLIPGSTVEFDFSVEDGYTLDSLLVNGTEMKNGLTIDNDRVYLSLVNVATDLNIKAQFSKISSQTFALSGSFTYLGSSPLDEVLSDLQVRAFDGFRFYDLNYSAETRGFIKVLPAGEYRIVVSSKKGGYEVKREYVNLVEAVDVEIVFSDKDYGDTRTITMDNALIMSGGYKEVNLQGKVTSDKFVHKFWLGLSDDAGNISEQTNYVNNWYIIATTGNYLRLQLIKWGDGYCIKFVDLDTGVDLTQSLTQTLIGNNGLYFGMIRDGNSVKVYAQDANGNMVFLLERSLSDAGMTASAQFDRVALECAEGCDSLHPSMVKDVVFVQGTTSFNDLPDVNG